MGSYVKAKLCGFLCRFCTALNKSVMLIYGEEGRRRNLVNKINTYIHPISTMDILPKTICVECLMEIEEVSRRIAAIEAQENRNRKCC